MKYIYTNCSSHDFIELCHGLDKQENRDTGELLSDVMALHRKIGYEVIPNYGHYKNMQDSICMRKEFWSDDTISAYMNVQRNGSG